MKDQNGFSWKAEWKAVGLDLGPLTEEEEVLVPQLIEANREFLKTYPPEMILKNRRLISFCMKSDLSRSPREI